MKFFYRSVLACCIITTLSASTPPIVEAPSFLFEQKDLEIPDLRTLSYDEVVDLLRFVESDDFEERCSLDELVQLNGLLSFLALEGAIGDEVSEVEEALATLFMPDCGNLVLSDSSEAHIPLKEFVFRP